jgi:hypothetical protein
MGRQSVYAPYFLRMVQTIHGMGVVATRLLYQEDDVPALFGLMGSVKRITKISQMEVCGNSGRPNPKFPRSNEGQLLRHQFDVKDVFARHQ